MAKTATAEKEAKKTTKKKATVKKAAKTGKKYLVIVESPAKAATIGKFLGNNYKIEASMGHVRDMPKSQMGIDFEHDFEPKYITIRGKGELLGKLRKDAKAADKVYLATEPDREGEAISWHLLHALNLGEEKPISRITFNEITKTAVKTQHDLDSWANLVARCLYMVGIRKTDVFQNSSGYGMFTGGLGFQYGAERLGALTVPAAAGNSKRQIKFITDFKTTALHAIPSYAIRLAEVFQEEGIDPTSTSLKTLVIGAEPHTDEQRRKIERMLGVKAYNSFGMAEMNGPGVAFECTEQDGMHFWEDCYLVEIINPETGDPVPEGEIGELVLTTLDREMMPLIRYRTRDLTRILPGKCPCGRTHIRIDRIKGRSDDMFIIKGVNIFPMQVEKVLVQFPELGSNYLITLETVNNQDEMIVEVELSDLSTDNYIELEKIRKAITRQLKDEILVTPKLRLVKKGSLPQSEGKAVRVKDLRNNK